ncbi:hypothetical protein [Brumimicrobium aurantiacum]|uniref:Phage holin family protein n=1 Tax=Brumimicrobium aurantiacum TaxID=1737063 RepID=A0A3E1EWA3_9FLAO|nr:hypothetical protein [Brumimicrobium aurantiacum]RFC53835.1 hypothetical protein DXU93_11965 [Brumimicrobium aurantiacum]
MKENNTTKEGIDELKKLVTTYIALFRIRSMKKATEVTTRVAYSLLVTILTMIGISFLGLALAIYLGTLLSSYALGFLIVGMIPIIAIILMRVFKISTFRYLLNFFTRLITNKYE